MNLNFNAGQAITILASVWGWIISKRKTWDYLVAVVTPLIAQAEHMAIDRVIDKAERKQLVLMAVARLEKDGKIKLNFITRKLLKMVVNKVAAKLPDFKISIEAKKIIEEEKTSISKVG